MCEAWFRAAEASLPELKSDDRPTVPVRNVDGRYGQMTLDQDKDGHSIFQIVRWLDVAGVAAAGWVLWTYLDIASDGLADGVVAFCHHLTCALRL
jgi:hypothetical protein